MKYKPGEIVKEGAVGGFMHGGDPYTYMPALWAWLVQTLSIRSVLDVGCGEGYAVAAFRALGCDVAGIDASRVALKNSIVPDAVQYWDLREGAFNPGMTIDLVWCCEVVEHIEERFIGNILATLASGRYAAITAARPGQRGYHHVNCREPDYWINAMLGSGMVYDKSLTQAAQRIAESENPKSHFVRNGLVFHRRTNLGYQYGPNPDLVETRRHRRWWDSHAAIVHHQKT